MIHSVTNFIINYFKAKICETDEEQVVFNTLLPGSGGFTFIQCSVDENIQLTLELKSKYLSKLYNTNNSNIDVILDIV